MWAVVTVFVLSIEERSEADGPDEIDDARLGVEAGGFEEREGGGGGGGTRRIMFGPAGLWELTGEAGCMGGDTAGVEDIFGGGTRRK